MVELRRKAERHFVVMDATINCDAGAYRAELLDVCSSGVGFSWIQSDHSLQVGTRVKIECRHPSLTLPPLYGVVKDLLPNRPYRPNERRCGVGLDDACRGPIELVVRSISNDVEAPDGSSVGFRRAWNCLSSAQRQSVGNFFENLKASGDAEKQAAANLLTDDNCPGNSLLNLLGVLLEEMSDSKNAGLSSFQVLDVAFKAYTERGFLIEDMERDRPIVWL